MTRFCSDCKWFQEYGYGGRCRKLPIAEPNPVKPDSLWPFGYEDCDKARKSGPCGKDGLLFEPRAAAKAQSWLRRVMR